MKWNKANIQKMIEPVVGKDLADTQNNSVHDYSKHLDGLQANERQVLIQLFLKVFWRRYPTATLAIDAPADVVYEVLNAMYFPTNDEEITAKNSELLQQLKNQALTPKGDWVHFLYLSELLLTPANQKPEEGDAKLAKKLRGIFDDKAAQAKQARIEREKTALIKQQQEEKQKKIAKQQQKQAAQEKWQAAEKEKLALKKTQKKERVQLKKMEQIKQQEEQQKRQQEQIQQEQQKQIEQEKQQQEQIAQEQQKQQQEQIQQEQQKQIEQEKQEQIAQEQQKRQQEQIQQEQQEQRQEQITQQQQSSPPNASTEAPLLNSLDTSLVMMLDRLPSYLSLIQGISGLSALTIFNAFILDNFTPLATKTACGLSTGITVIPLAIYYGKIYLDKTKLNTEFDAAKLKLESGAEWDIELFDNLVLALQKLGSFNVDILTGQNEKILFLKKVLAIYAVLAQYSPLRANTFYNNVHKILMYLDVEYTGLKNAHESHELFLINTIPLIKETNKADQLQNKRIRLNNHLITKKPLTDKQEQEMAQRLIAILTGGLNFGDTYKYIVQCYQKSCVFNQGQQQPNKTPKKK